MGVSMAINKKAMRYSFVSVGIWWMLFSQYSFYYMPKGNKKDAPAHKLLFNGFKELKLVWGQLENNRKLKRYLVAFFVYSMAVQTVMLIAAFFGEEEIGWGSDEQRTVGLISSILIIQLVAIVGATLTAKASEKFGNIPTLIGVNALWTLICVYAYFVVSPMEFYVAAGLVGMVMGGIQALSRSTYSKLMPATQDTTSFFSFYDVAEKIGIVIGTFIYGALAQGSGDLRNGIIMFGIFFLVGGLLLKRVK